MSLFSIILNLLGLGSPSSAAPDCATVKPFPIIATYQTAIGVMHRDDLGRDDVEICATKTPLAIPVLDIRGREGEWFYCTPRDDASRELVCAHDGVTIVVRPALVVRNWKLIAAFDANAHVLLSQSSGGSRDVFARSLGFDLSPRNFVVEGRTVDWSPAGRLEGDYAVTLRFSRLNSGMKRRRTLRVR